MTNFETYVIENNEKNTSNAILKNHGNVSPELRAKR